MNFRVPVSGYCGVQSTADAGHTIHTMQFECIECMNLDYWFNMKTEKENNKTTLTKFSVSGESDGYLRDGKGGIT